MKRTDITALFPEATDEQIQKIMDLNGGDINKAKGDLQSVQDRLAAAQTELDQLKAKDSTGELATVKAELEALKASNALRDLRAQVSKATGVPADLLTGDTEEACKAQAEAIKAYSQAQQPTGYPNMKDGGNVSVSNPSTPREKFAEWVDKNFSTR